MVNNSRTTVLLICVIVFLTEADVHSALINFLLQPQQSEEISPPTEEGTLREYADRVHIWIGTAIQLEYWDKDALYKQILAKEFNSAVAFVFMNRIQPKSDKFDFRRIDKAIQFARENNMKLAGASLIYHNQTVPRWLGFDKPNCGGWRKDDLDRIMKKFIQAVVSYGGNDFYTWKVVNEPLTNEAKESRCWYKILGEDYIVRAFRYAHEANPGTLLMLNETFGGNGIGKKRTDEFFTLIKRLKGKGVPIHVAGIQMHLEAHRLRPGYLEEFRYFLKEAGEVGVQVHVTEMDVYQGPPGFFKKPFDKQKEIFKAIMSACLEFSHCTSLTTWGLTDKHSWLRIKKQNPYPDAKPLLFDENYRRKPAYVGIMEAIRENRGRRA